jgi:hypothetical protein
MVADPHVGLSAIALQSGGDANTNNILEVTETGFILQLTQ